MKCMSRMWLRIVPGIAGVLCLTLGIANGRIRAEEPVKLPDQKLGTLDLEAPPSGWSKAVPDHLTQVDEAGHGKVLKITGIADQNPGVDVTIDLTPYLDKTLIVIVTAKVPACASPDGKPEQKPRVVVELKDSNDVSILPMSPDKSKLDWQTLRREIHVPPNAVSMTVRVVVQSVVCEALFDTLTVTAPAPAPAAVATVPATTASTTARPPGPPRVAVPRTNPATTAAAPKTAAATTAAPALVVVPSDAPAVPASGDPNDPKAIAAKAEKRNLDDGGIQFGPEEAGRLLTDAEKKKSTQYNLMAIGPGFTEKEALKPPGNWKVSLPPKLVGPKVTPRQLLTQLPEVLVKEHPEVVMIGTDLNGARKATNTESDDWEDVARLCERFGAAPAFMILPPGEKDKKDENFENILAAVRKARDVNNLPMLIKPPETLSKRVGVYLVLLDKYVFQRTKTEQPGTGTGTTPKKKGPVEE